jgi:glycine/D-amino acid oxidase-like deaminating enzyme
MQIDVLPQDARPSGWYLTMPPAPEARRLEGRQEADWVVVGAGFTGVAAARRLGELAPGSRVVLVDAQRAGMGASGRNSGFIIDAPHNADASDGEMAANRRILRLNRFAIDWLEELVEKHQIRCQWARRGQYRMAATAAGIEGAEPIAALSSALDVPCERLDRDQAAERLGTRYYAAGVYQPGTVLMQPAALVSGLAHSLPPNVTLYEDSPITGIDYGPPHRLRTSAGEIVTPRLVLATNGFTDGWGFLPNRLIRLVTYASLTEPLSERQMQGLGSDPNWGVTCTVRMGSTVRRTADNRLLMRNCVRYGGDTAVGEAELARARASHLKSIAARYPDLGELELAATWAGFVCVSRNSAPFWGELAPGVLASVCCNGVGVPKGTFAGRAIAEYALGHDSDLVRDMLAFPKAANHGLGPLIGVATSLRLAYNQFRAGREH